MKYSILANIGDQNKGVKTNNENLKYTYEFFKKPPDEDDFDCEIVEDILNDEWYEHKKVETPYVESAVQDATTIDDQIKKEIDDFLLLASEFNKVDAAGTRPKNVDYYDKLFEDVESEPDRRQKNRQCNNNRGQIHWRWPI